MSHFIYVLKSEVTGRLYTGMTADLDLRLAAHNAGKVKSTKAYRPWKLIYREVFQSLGTARKREIYLKSGFGRKFLKQRGIK